MRKSWPFAVVSIAWLLEDGLSLAPQLRAKLGMPQPNLSDALASLTPLELEEVKNGILQTAEKGALAGPLRANELCAFLDSVQARVA